MEKLINKIEIKESNNEYIMFIPLNEITKVIDESLANIHLTGYNKYLTPNNDDLINELILRISVEIFISKQDLEEEKPYIVNLIIGDTKYRLSVYKLKLDNEYKYMYGLIMN